MSTTFENAPCDDTNNAPGFYEKLARAITESRARLQAHYERLFPGRSVEIHLAIEEAESAAWCTPFPHLFLPDFAEMQVARYAFARVTT
jgi:hypothetical protein